MTFSRLLLLRNIRHFYLQISLLCWCTFFNQLFGSKDHVSRNLLQFKSRWLLAHDPRHFTTGTVFFDVFIKYKYLHLFSARRFTISDIIQKYPTHLRFINSFTSTFFMRLTRSTMRTQPALTTIPIPPNSHSLLTSIYTIGTRIHILLPQVPLRKWNMFTDIFVPILWFIISPQATTRSQVMSVTSLCGIGCYHYKAKFMSHHVFMHATI